MITRLPLAALITAWDIGARRAAGLKSFVRGGLREARWLPVTFIAIPLGVYLASWSGWFATSTGYYRDYAATHGVHTPVISALYSLYEYHLQAISFGVGLKTPHPYQSQPWDWLLVTRPVAFFYECYTGPVPGPSHYCPSGYKGAEWSQEVLALGTRRGPAAEARLLYEEAAVPVPLVGRQAAWIPLLADEAEAGD